MLQFMYVSKGKISNMGKIIKIHLKAKGEGTLYCSELGTFKCLGKPGFPYKKDITINTNSKQFIHRSAEFGGYEMYYSILIHGLRGVYIHAGSNNIIENEGPSAGCIHLKKSDARKVYNWVDTSVRVLTTVSW